ncbi:hypothetical protein DFH06DRAFT_981093, partial [Mycena polygramma]
MDVNSPRKKAPFSPRKVARATSPDDEDDDYDVNVPLGCALLLRSVYTAGSPITSTSAVTLAQKTINSLLEADPELPNIILTPFSTAKPSSACYARLPFNPDEPDDTPRFDLLDQWRVVLVKEKPEWEVVWQPIGDGKDKRMTIRFGDTGFQKEKGDKSACAPLEKIKIALAGRGITYTDSYCLPSGAYLTLANHRHVDDILAAGAVTVSTVSANPITASRCRQIEVHHCFDVVISGLTEGEGVQSSLCKWIVRNIRDPVTDEKCFVSARVPPYERESIVVCMTDWSATSRLLSAGDEFVKRFSPNLPNIHRPQLVVALNNQGFWRPKSMTQTFRDGADSVNESLKALRGELQEHKRETRVQHETQQRAISEVTKTVGSLHSSLGVLGQRLANQASAFLALAGEQTIRAQLTQVQMTMNQHQNTIKFGLPEYHDEAKAEYAKLFIEQAALTKSLASSAGQSIALLGGTLGSAIETPLVPPGIARIQDRPERSRSPSPSDSQASKKRKGTNDKPEDDLMTEGHHPPPPVSSTRSSIPSNLLIAARDVSSAKHLKCSETTRAPSRVWSPRGFHGASLKGRLLAIDVILPTDSGRGFVHRVVGVYAPWDPGINNIDPNAREFWADVTEFCNSTLTSWSMGGDYNATVSSTER